MALASQFQQADQIKLSSWSTSLTSPKPNLEPVKLKEALRNFLVEVMKVDPDEMRKVSLEDVYTPIDRCLSDGVSLRNKSLVDLHTLRAQMEYLISLAIDQRFDAQRSDAKQYVRDFATHLVKEAFGRKEKAARRNDASAAKAYDPFSIISLNWDILLDRCLYEELTKKDGGRDGDYEPIGVVDYCCYISSVEAWEKRIRPGLWTLGARGYNVKLLKIHGSMNWLQCSNCQRLFVSFHEKVNIPNYINAQTCRHCEQFGIKAKLQGSLIMPTFLKDLTNFQVKLIWQNASVELMEAKRLVFIGYSLPHADFEFRQLLSRMVHAKAKIHVVLYNDGTSDGERRYTEECNRYRQFFGSRKVTFEPDGVAEFVRKECS